MKIQKLFATKSLAIGLSAMVVLSCTQPEPETFDVIIRGGTVYDGLGGAPYQADIGIRGDRVAAIGDLSAALGTENVDATGLAVSPGFINMLSWAVDSLIADGRGLSDIKQGVTLEVFGEGWSYGPWSDAMKADAKAQQGEITYDIDWTTLGEYLDSLTNRGISPNVASFVGATTLRIHQIGFDDRAATADELAAMQELVRAAMREGALGVGSSLIYAPSNYADTAELTALMQAASEYGGMYISHMRSEGDLLEEAVAELITIAREANAPAEIYHLKAAGKQNWGKLESVFAMVEAARAEGLQITADMYTYPAGATGLDASVPVWVHDGGQEKFLERIRDPETRATIVDHMYNGYEDWENLFLSAGPENIMLTNFCTDELDQYMGMRLSQVAEARGDEDPAVTALNLLSEDECRIETIYFMMTEENLPKKIRQPWLSFGSDAGAIPAEGAFLDSPTHPRAYGTFARVLGKYARDEGVISLAEAVRKLTSLPAGNMKIRDRGRLAEGYFADIAIFDAATISDHATFEEPHQYATGMVHVFVNGQQVLKDGEHTGATPGQVVRGPGWDGWGEVD